MGAMMLTWTPEPAPDEQAFEALKAGIALLPEDTKLIINSGEFYGFNPRTANLELLCRFLTSTLNLQIEPSYPPRVELEQKT
ncbi:hypothetical protein FRC03_005448 [Tulasnella sp. 419]|nr:hypothetical protein FRC03_005448 [Tulasnella sp. 419]